MNNFVEIIIEFKNKTTAIFNSFVANISNVITFNLNIDFDGLDQQIEQIRVIAEEDRQENYFQFFHIVDKINNIFAEIAKFINDKRNLDNIAIKMSYTFVEDLIYQQNKFFKLYFEYLDQVKKYSSQLASYYDSEEDVLPKFKQYPSSSFLLEILKNRENVDTEVFEEVKQNIFPAEQITYDETLKIFGLVPSSQCFSFEEFCKKYELDFAKGIKTAVIDKFAHCCIITNKLYMPTDYGLNFLIDREFLIKRNLFQEPNTGICEKVMKRFDNLSFYETNEQNERNIEYICNNAMAPIVFVEILGNNLVRFLRGNANSINIINKVPNRMQQYNQIICDQIPRPFPVPQLVQAKRDNRESLLAGFDDLREIIKQKKPLDSAAFLQLLKDNCHKMLLRSISGNNELYISYILQIEKLHSEFLRRLNKIKFDDVVFTQFQATKLWEQLFAAAIGIMRTILDAIYHTNPNLLRIGKITHKTMYFTL